MTTNDASDARVYDFAARQAPRTDADTAEPAPGSPEAPGQPLEDAGEGGPARVDSPDAQRAGLFDRIANEQRRSVLPAWARSRSELGDTSKWVAGYYAHTAAYHAVRAPLYAGRLGARAPRGAGRVLTGVSRWTGDAEGAPARAAAVAGNDPERYLKLSRQRDARVRSRSIIAAIGAAVALTLAVAGWALLPAVVLWPAVAVLVGGLGMAGGPADKPLIDRAVVSTQVAKLTSDVVLRALGALGIGEINRALAKDGGPGITFPAPIVRDGPGWRADIDLPYGVTVPEILDRRAKLASGLRRPLGCVWPEPDPSQHEGRLVLWVGDQDMNQAKQPPWPLARSGQADVFAPMPFGHDQRTRPVTLTLMFNSVLIGAMPRQGKTFALRVLALGVALDPRVQLRVFELKGTGDLSPVAKVAHRYGSGPDDDTVKSCLDSLREVEKDLQRRSSTISQLPKSQCPENKVTPELAARQDLGLHPVALIIDECQELFAHPEYGKDSARLAERIIKLGPAMGIMLLLATQRPDKDSLPTGVSANAGIRLCLRVMGQTENDMVLGTSAYKNGIRATTFTAKDKGIGYLVGATDDPQIVRSAYIDAEHAEKITDRARGLREAAGTLTGHAIGQAPEASEEADTLLEDILTVLGPEAQGSDRWNETIATRLAEHRPDVYGNWGAEQLTTALKPHGIKTGQVWGTGEDGTGRNRRGIDPTQVAKILTERSRKRDNP